MSAKRANKWYEERIARGDRTDWARLRAMTEEEIARTSPPELANLPEDFWDEAVLVVPPAKQAISLRVDKDVLDWFKEQGPLYQSRMNAVLRRYYESQLGKERPGGEPAPRAVATSRAKKARRTRSKR